MKEVWILTENNEKCRAFTGFEKAKTVFRQRIARLAENDSGVFRHGQLFRLENYLNENGEYIYDNESETDLNVEHLLKTLNRFFTDPTYEPSVDDLPDIDAENCMLRITYDQSNFCVFGHEEGPCNGVDPDIRINCFQMNSEATHYFLIVSGYFDDDEDSGEIRLDLHKAELED